MINKIVEIVKEEIKQYKTARKAAMQQAKRDCLTVEDVLEMSTNGMVIEINGGHITNVICNL